MLTYAVVVLMVGGLLAFGWMMGYRIATPPKRGKEAWR